jgi:RNA polymerase sigma factor (TIGR02999 family)
LLERWREGDRAAVSELMTAVYHELHAMARAALRNERPGHTLQSTALVHEAYLRLVKMDGVRWQNRPQFFSIAAQVLRHILVDYARERRAKKRGANPVRITLDDALAISPAGDYDFEALDQALEKLARRDERKAKIVELRYFTGLSIDEVAEVLGCSPMTVKRDWNFARAWLYRELKA